MVRTRFAPSPTGFVHIGSVRTALFSFLYARHNNGKHILRIEDTDQNRFVEGAVENLLKVMKQIGIEFDEGYYLDSDNSIKEKGDFGPYLQSKRLDKYQAAAKQLIEDKKAYYCFCSQERLDALRKEQMALKKPAMYDRHCRNLPEAEVKTQMEDFKSKGKNPVVRFAIPLEGATKISDLIFGDITYENKILDDQVIIKSDGFPTYHLAVVVDDHTMEITHVIRGDEWLPSTPKHVLIYQALGWKPTKFAHLPLILNPDKTKLSKRQGDVAVEDFFTAGYLKEALINFVAFLGWNPKTEKELFTLDELIAEFDLEKINKSGAVFDINKLDWLNGQYIKQMDNSHLTNQLLPHWQKYWADNNINFDKTSLSHEYFEKIAALEKDRLKKLSEIGDRTVYFFTATDYDPNLLIWKKSDKDKTKQILNDLSLLLGKLEATDFTTISLEEKIKAYIQEKSLDNGSVLWPLRTALTGLEKSPGPFEVTSILYFGLGKEEIVKRLKNAEEKL